MNYRITLHTGHELSDYSSHGSRIIELFFTRIITDDHEIFISRDILEKNVVFRNHPYEQSPIIVRKNSTIRDKEIKP